VLCLRQHPGICLRRTKTTKQVRRYMRQHTAIRHTVHPKHVKLQLPFCSVSLPPRVRLCNSLLKINFSRNNSTKSPASGADNVSEAAGLERGRSRLPKDHCFCNRGDGVDSILLIT